MSKRLFYCDHHVIPLPANHRFPSGKHQLIRESLGRDGHYTFEPAMLAAVETIELAHDSQYIHDFMHGGLPAAAVRRIGFPWTPELVRRTLASLGGTLQATQEALESGWGCNMAGGTHHAFRAEGAGYCVFNDFAVAIQWLRNQGRVHRAAIVDLDVHQGDGTAEMFLADPSVFTLSIHCESNFPFRKRQSSLDVALAEGTSDQEYLRALDAVLPEVMAFAPEIVFYQAGVDGLASDRLGRLSLTHAGLRERDRRVMVAAKAYGLPLVVTLGGGYSLPLELAAEAHANVFRMAAEVFG